MLIHVECVHYMSRQLYGERFLVANFASAATGILNHNQFVINFSMLHNFPYFLCK